MGATKKYFSRQFRANMFLLDHESSTDFYLSCWQNNRSSFGLLLWRTLLFLACIGILLTSLILMAGNENPNIIQRWPIYMTHWGVVLITCTTGFAFLTSVVAYSKGSINAVFGLPWYVKAYWVLSEISVPVAWFITLFYYTLLKAELEMDTEIEVDYGFNPILDLLVHGMNSVVMFLLMFTSRMPFRILHFIYPILATIIYMVFSLVYYYSGGTDPFGNVWIYPMLDWSNPGTAAITVVMSAAMLLIVHIVAVVIAVLRDVLAKKCGFLSETLDISGYN